MAIKKRTVETTVGATTQAKNDLKLISALTNRPVYVIVSDLASKELRRLQRK